MTDERSGAKIDINHSAMAATVPLVELQSRLEKSLSELGYTGKVGKLPAAIEGNDQMMRFVSWVVDNLTPENHLTTAELQKFEELKSSNTILEGEALDHALAQLGPGGDGGRQSRQSEEAIAREVEGMREEVTSLKTQLHTLNSIRKKMSDHYGSVVGGRDQLLEQKTEAQHSFLKSMDRGKEDNKKVNSALEDLSSSVKEVCAFHRGEGAGQSQDTPTFLSTIPQDAYHRAEDDYLSQLTAYTKKQFQGIGRLVESSQEDTAEFGEVDLGDREQVLLRGVTEEQHSKHRHELARLQALYPLTEMQYINAQLSEQHALAACRRAEEEMAALSQGEGEVLDHGKLRHQLKLQQERLAELRAQIQELGETQVPDLLQDMATLQISKVLHGDYDLKIARQNYFTSKQDKVIEYLRRQQARQELLSMLYEVELRRHRETHRLLSAAEKQLSQWKEEGEKRSQAMQNPAIRPVTTAKQTVDSRDKTAQRMCTLLGVEPSSTAPLVTYASLHEAVKQLVHQLTSLQALLSSHSNELKQLLDEQESLTEKFELTLFGDSGEQRPLLTMKEYEEEHSKLVSVVTSMEQNIKALLKDFDSKKKILQANPLMETERKLFVYFFTNPGKLRQVVSELAHRIDALATANTVATS